MLFAVNGTSTAMVMHKAAGLVSYVRRVLALDRRECNHLRDGQQQLQCRERALSEGLFVQLFTFLLLSLSLSEYGLQLLSIASEDCSAATEMLTGSLSQQISNMLSANEKILKNPSMVWMLV